MAAYLLKKRTAMTTFQWVKGHDGIQGNEESDRLAKVGANKNDPDNLDLEIPKNFDLQGAKLSTMTQALAYRGILERKTKHTRRSTDDTLKHTREAIANHTGNIRVKIRQFLYK
jgi:hypothetical protein